MLPDTSCRCRRPPPPPPPPSRLQVQQLKYLMRCVNESMRLYPHPPVLLRRAMVDDVLPGELNKQGGVGGVRAGLGGGADGLLLGG